MKPDKIFKFVFFLLLLIYLTLYFTGNEQIEKFEEDVKSGKEVNVEDYITKEKKDYNNKISDAGKKVSFTISNTLSKLLTSTFKHISKFITE